MPITRIALTFLLFPIFSFAQVQKLAEGYAEKLPMGGIVILQSRAGVSQLGTAGNVSAERAEPPAVDDVFEIGSISKVFTGVLLAESVHAGTMALDDTLDQYLPEGVLGPRNPLRKTTLLQLTTHTSGLQRMPDNFAEARGYTPDKPYQLYRAENLYAFLRTLDDAELTPGKMAYSNLGVGLLGHLIERAWEKPYAELLEERIANPLNMTQTAVMSDVDMLPKAIREKLVPPHVGKRVSPHWGFGVMAPAGGIVSSAADLMKFAQAYWDEDTPEGLKASLSLAAKQHAASPVKKAGLGWFIGPGGILLHDGATGGFHSVLRVNPKQRFARVELVNQSSALVRQQSVITKIEGPLAPLASTWKGLLVAGPKVKLRLEWVVEETPKGDLRCQLFSPDQHDQPIPVNRASLSEGRLSFEVDAVGGRFEGTLNERGDILDGTWTQGPNTLPLRLKRDSLAE